MLDLFGQDKECVAIERIRTFEPSEGYYVAFSGGKDSVVVYDLVKRAGVKCDVHMNKTSVDPPELIRFIKYNYTDVEFHKPEKTMFQLIPLKRMPPTRAVRYCCEALKEQGGEERFVITGIRADESYKRRHRKMVEYCNKYAHKRYLHCIIDWTSQDVWNYIRKYSLPYCELYDQGMKRIGCICCPLTDYIKRDGARWPKFKKAYLLAFDKMIKLRIRDGLPTQWQSSEEVWQWWLHTNKKRDPNQQCFVYD